MSEQQTTTPSERAGQLTAEERERYGRVAYDTHQGHDWMVASKGNTRPYVYEGIAAAVIAAYLRNHPRDDAGERSTAIERAARELLTVDWAHAPFEPADLIANLRAALASPVLVRDASQESDSK